MRMLSNLNFALFWKNEVSKQAAGISMKTSNFYQALDVGSINMTFSYCFKVYNYMICYRTHEQLISGFRLIFWAIMKDKGLMLLNIFFGAQ